MNKKFIDLDLKAYFYKKDIRQNPKKTFRKFMEEVEQIGTEAIYKSEFMPVQHILFIGNWNSDDRQSLGFEMARGLIKQVRIVKAEEKAIIGTSYIGRIAISYTDLLFILGRPHKMGSSDSKVGAQWAYQFNKKTLVTIYNYKSKNGIIQETDWHIGGKGNREFVKEWVQAVFSQKI